MKKKQTNSQHLHERAVPDVVVAAEQEEKRSRHIFAKLVCLLISVCVWLYVMNQETANYEREFTQIPVTVDGVAQLHADSNMSVIYGYDNTVDVIVSGKKSDVQDLTTEDIRVSLDVSNLSEAGKFTLPVKVQLPDGFFATNADRLTAEIYVDINTQREIPVKIQNLDYIVNSSYLMGTPVLSKQTVTVTGPAQVLDLIDCAALDFDLGTVTTSVTMVGTPTLVDEDGLRISNPYVRCNNNEITVEIPVSTTKELKLVASYALTELRSVWTSEIIPSVITVTGDPALLATLDDIVVYNIASNAVEGEYTVGSGVIDLPRGVTVKTMPEKITVKLIRVEG